MTERDEQRAAREENLRQLTDLGLPYAPYRYGPTMASGQIQDRYSELEGAEVCVAGRLVLVRVMGKASFAHVQDASGQIQLYFKRDDLGDDRYAYFKLLDIGDIIGVRGTVFKTRTGEVTIHVQDLVLLAKSFHPLPDKFHGLSDVEVRYRRRYLDLIANEDARRIFGARARLVRDIRRFLDDRGFVEVETPILQTLYGGAAAAPFTTHYDALDTDVFLRISDELYLKRLIVGGMERVYEIGRDFRNEGFSKKHSPEFTMLEWYEAYSDYKDVMARFEELIVSICDSALGSRCVTANGHEIDITPPWRRMSLGEAMRDVGNVAVDIGASRDELVAEAARLGVHVAADASRGKVVEDLFSALVEPNLIEPTYIYDYPVDFPGSLLAKRKRDDSTLAERFEMFMGGIELANGFSELNEPGDQLARMQEAARMRGDEHADVDSDYILALEYGMPPTGGIGFGIDRLTMLVTGAQHIRETILFPLLRPREDEHA